MYIGKETLNISFATVSNVQSTTRILSKHHYHAFVRHIGNTMLPNAIRLHPTYDPVTFNVSFMAALIDFDGRPAEILHKPFRLPQNREQHYAVLV